MKLRMFVLSFALLAAACSDDFDPASRVSELRLLAARVDRPFAQPGERVELHALAHDPAGRALHWAFGLCRNDASSEAIDCLRSLSFEQLSLSRDPGFAFSMPSDASTYVGVAVVVCPGEIVRGSTAGIPLACVDEERRELALAEYELGLKRVFVRPASENQNPHIAELTWDSAPWPEGELRRASCERVERERCASFAKHALELQAPAAAEHSVDRQGKPMVEQAVAQFYATGGEFDDDVRMADRAHNGFRPRREDAGKRLTLWFVVRDDRGGTAWTTRELDVP